MARKQDIFTRLAERSARATGHPAAFIISVVVVVLWGFTGPFFHYSDAWQLVVNSITNIATFLMVFLIQNAQNRDSRAAQIKLDEIIRCLPQAHTALMDLEELSEEELVEINRQYEELAAKARKKMREGKPDTGVPEIDPREKGPE